MLESLRKTLFDAEFQAGIKTNAKEKFPLSNDNTAKVADVIEQALQKLKK